MGIITSSGPGSTFCPASYGFLAKETIQAGITAKHGRFRRVACLLDTDRQQDEQPAPRDPDVIDMFDGFTDHERARQPVQQPTQQVPA